MINFTSDEMDFWKGNYRDLGFETLPLCSGTKHPIQKNWQHRSSKDLWITAPRDANIGLRAGGDLKVAFIDCDEFKRPGTFQNIQGWLAGIGYLPEEYPVIQTASGIGRHIYVTFSGGLQGNYSMLSADLGAGEFRYGTGAYVVAPPSIIAGGEPYCQVAGDLRQLPHLEMADVLPILTRQNNSAKKEEHSIPRRARKLIQGIGLDQYPSRSEADESIIVALVNKDFSFDEVLQVFLDNPCSGKFWELQHDKSLKDAIRWLRTSYENGIRWAKKNESISRQISLAAMKWAESSSWSGRMGSNDRVVFMAHCDLSYQSGKSEYAASSRTLAERAGISHTSATNATHRLISADLIELVRPGFGEYAHIYRLSLKLEHFHMTHCEGVENFETP